MKHASLTVRAIRTRAVNVPMRRPLGTSAARMVQAPFVLVDIDTEEGVTGCAYAFCYLDIAMPMLRSVIDDFGEALNGKVIDPLRLRELGRKRYGLLGTAGVVGMALSVLDVAFWDAVSRAAGQPLARYLDADSVTVPVYNSNGLSLGGVNSLADEALELLEPGFSALKIRLGREDPGEDLAAVTAVRDAIPEDAKLMSDFNQALTAAEAIERGIALDSEGLEWIEEPVAHDDLLSCAEVAASVDTPIQIGENFTGPSDVATAARVGAMDYVMVDLMRIGGVTGWLEASAIATDARIHLSSHLYPEVSAHLLAASATGHWLEYVDWAEPLLEAPLEITAGRAIVRDVPGTGMRWNEALVADYSVD